MVHFIEQVSQKLNAIKVQKCPDVAHNWDYEHAEFSQAHVEIVSCFRFSTRDNTLQPYTTLRNTNSNEYPEKTRPGYNLSVFDRKYLQDYATPQTVDVNFEISGPVDAALGLGGHGPQLSNKVLSIIGDGHRRGDLIEVYFTNCETGWFHHLQKKIFFMFTCLTKSSTIVFGVIYVLLSNKFFWAHPPFYLKMLVLALIWWKNDLYWFISLLPKLIR